jgi:dipeptidyl aminopeptidase/acylaminoacyl peptidase
VSLTRVVSNFVDDLEMRSLLALLAFSLDAHADTCAGNALVTLDDGAIVAVDWPTRSDNELNGRVVVNRTLEVSFQQTVERDGGVTRVTTTTHTLGGKPAVSTQTLPAGSVYWSDAIASTLEQVVLRARSLGTHAVVPLVAASKDVPRQATVDAIDGNNYTIAVGPRSYDVIVDDHGCLLAATLAAYGITYERRDVAPDAYPLEDRYAAPANAPYTSRDVRISTSQGHVLAGTLTRPKAGGRAPAVIMITGISKHERNEGNPPFTPFRDLADVLGRAGIAVLRVDDRGVGESTGDFDKATSFDEADDVRSELAWLRKQPGIDAKRIGLVGHSEGGFIALVVAAGDPALAAVVVLAGSGVPGEQLNTWQTIQTVEHDPAVAPDKRAAEIGKQLADRSDWSPRDKAFVAADPADYARRVKTPALIIQGGTDLHVPPRSAERLAVMMRAAGNRDVTVRIIPQLSHTLSPDITGHLQGWSWLPSRRLSNALLEDVARWLGAELHARGT